MARGGIFVVVEVIVPNQLFSWGDIAERKNPNVSFDFVDFAVGIAGVIQKRAQAFAVYDGLAVFQSVKVGPRGAVIAAVGLFRRDALAGVFDDAGSFANRSRSVDADGMNG
jgi:hypothetical protein